MTATSDRVMELHDKGLQNCVIALRLGTTQQYVSAVVTRSLARREDAKQEQEA
jgi:transcriptional regulator